METSQATSKKTKLNLDFKDSKYATGRRKTSIAKVWLKKGSGKIYVNGKLFDQYFVSENHKMQITRPFEIINQATDYDVRCSVTGGGHTGQAGAMVHGISKALVMFDENLKSTLKTENLTTRDPRAVERKNLVEEKLEEASNSLKDNFFLFLNCYSIKCVSLMY
jgi:small subunit ribosomal protein S9